MSSMSMATTSGATTLEFEVRSALYYVVVGAGSILVLLIICVGVLSLCLLYACLWQNRASTCMSINIVFLSVTIIGRFITSAFTQQLENPAVHNSSDMTMLSKEGRNTCD